jgi:predicted aspartyl protease
MAWFRIWAGLAAVATATSLHAQKTMSVETVSKPGIVDTSSQTEDVNFKPDQYARMTVPVQVSDTGPYRFIVDTGADRTAISRELAAHLGLEAGRGAILHSVTGKSGVQTVMVPRLQLTRKHVRVDDAPLLLRANIGADGILGIDSLRSQRVMFDFKKDTMSIVPSIDTVTRDDEDTIIVRARSRNGRLVLTHARAEGIDVTIVLDTGSQVSVGNAALRTALERKAKLRNRGQVELVSVTGDKMIGDSMLVNKLDLGDVALRDLAIVFADAHTFRQLDLENRPAILLGMNAMRGFDRVSIDFARKQFRVVLPEKSELEGRRLAAR